MRSPGRLRIPSDSPVSSDSSTVSPRESTTGPSATTWSPGSTRTRSPGTISSACSSSSRPSRITFARGATSSARRSSVSFAFSSWRIPIAELTIAIRPKIASAQSPSERMRMKKPPMIALNSVSVLASTMLLTERLVCGSRGPSRSRRRAASALESP